MFCGVNALAGKMVPLRGKIEFIILNIIDYLKKSSADKNWTYDFAVELDAMQPDILRSLVADALEPHMPKELRDWYIQMEAQDRATIRMALTDLS